MSMVKEEGGDGGRSSQAANKNDSQTFESQNVWNDEPKQPLPIGSKPKNQIPKRSIADDFDDLL